MMSHWLPFFLILSCFHCDRATITLTSTVDGRQAACPGEVVTYTCTVIQGASLTWSAPPVLADDGGVVFVPTNGRQLNCSNDTVQCDDLDFQAILTSVGTIDMNGAANMTSTFMFTATFELSARGTVVKCSALTDPSSPPLSMVLNVTGLPSPPRASSYTVRQYGRDSVMLTLQWQSPQDDGGAPVNYTITVSPGFTEGITGTSFSLPAIPYNVMHNVSIVATNCNGSSSAVMETIRIVNCSDPATPGNGFIESYQNTTEGAEISFRCNSGFVPNTATMAICGADGRWNPDPATLTCTFDCGPPALPRSGSVELYTNTTVGSVVFYSCHPGFVPEIRMMSVCTRSGWSPNPGALSCSVGDCGPPAVPRNGSVELYTNTSVGSVVFYSCHPGFVPERRIMSVCTRSGWSPNPGVLTCSVVNCGMPIGPRNGFIEPYQSTLGGTEIFFMCVPGFVPAGRMRAKCESDGITVTGTWTPDPAALVCNASTVDCGDPNNASSEVIVQYCSTQVGSVIFYQCRQSGFAPSSLSAVCMESGRWSPDPSQVVCRMVTTAVPMPTPTGEMYTPDRSLSPAAATAITTVVCSLVAFITGALCGVMVTVCISKWKKRSKPTSSVQEQQSTVAVYEEVDAQSEKIELKENAAYVPVKVQ